MQGAARIVFAACWLLLPARVLATQTVQLSYARAEGAESCPNTLEVRKAISQRLGYDPVDPSSPQIIFAIVEPTATGFRGRVELIAGGSSQGLRELTSQGSCAELISALSLSMSIAIDPERVETAAASSDVQSVEASTAPGVAVASPLASAEAQPPPPSPEASPRPRRQAIAPAPAERSQSPRREGLNLPIAYSLGAFVEMASGFTPAIAAGGSLLVRGRHGLFSLSLEGRVDAPSGIELPGGARVQGGLAALVIAPCLHYGPGFGCLLGLGGEVWASSSAVSDKRSDVALYGAVGARLGLDWPERGIWAISLHADALRPLTKISIVLDRKTVWAARDVALAFGGGVVVRF